MAGHGTGLTTLVVGLVTYGVMSTHAMLGPVPPPGIASGLGQSLSEDIPVGASCAHRGDDRWSLPLGNQAIAENRPDTYGTQVCRNMYECSVMRHGYLKKRI